MLKDFVPRLYQQTIFASSSEKNSLVVLPTGLGKTYIFMMLAAYRLKRFPGKKILFLGPTRPLISQYHAEFLKHMELSDEDMAIFTGQVRPEKRQELWENSKIIFSTPQGLENDIITKRIDLKSVSLLGFDEAHRAVGDYSYVWIAKQYHKEAIDERIIALTASPGSDIEKIKEVISNLYIENVEIRTDSDPDVKPYIKDVDVKWIYVDLPLHFKKVHKYLKDCFDSKIKKVVELSNINKPIENKTDLLALQSLLLSKIKNERDFESMKSISFVAQAMKVGHAIELLESQGISPLYEYLMDLIKKSKTTKTKAVINLVQDINFKSAVVLTKNLKEIKIEHPKHAELKRLVSDRIVDKKTKIIVFSQYRDSISALVEELNKIPGAKAEMFVGQQKKKGSGLTQKEQIGLIDKFRENVFNILVMSSVGEEGLDIPAVDTVIFYEPVPSAIRTIQRRGRTGRQSKGEVIVLVTKDTRDEGYRWSSHHKEKRMHRILEEIRTRFVVKKEKKLTEFIVPEEGLSIYADYREKGSGIIKKLVDLGINVNLKQLEVGDYIVGEDICIEYKTVPDFVDSLIDKRLFTQLRNMKKYRKQIIIIEGEEDLYSQRNIHENAIRGLLSTIALDYKVPILTTKNNIDSALMIAMIAKRNSNNDPSGFTMHSGKPLTLHEQQEYVVSSLPGVGPILSKPLLEHFGSIKKILNADENELKKVSLIGEKKAKTIRHVIDSDYKS